MYKKYLFFIFTLIFLTTPILTYADQNKEVEIIIQPYSEVGENIDIYIKNNLDEPVYYFDGCFPAFQILGPLENGSLTSSQINRPWLEECDSFVDIIKNQFKFGINKHSFKSLIKNQFFTSFIKSNNPFRDNMIKPRETKLIYAWDQKAYVRTSNKELDEREAIPGNNYMVKFNFARKVKDFKLPIKFSNILLNIFFKNKDLILESTESEYFRIGVEEIYDPTAVKAITVYNNTGEIDLGELEKKNPKNLTFNLTKID